MTLKDYLREQLNLPVLGQLGASLGLRATRAVPIADEVLPAQLDQLEQIASTPAGSQQLWDLAQSRVPKGNIQQLTGTPEGIRQLQLAGTTLLPELMGPTHLAEISRLAARSKISEVQVRQLMEMLLPLLLGLIAKRATAEHLKPAALGSLFGGTVSPGTTVTLASTPDVVIAQEPPVQNIVMERETPPPAVVREESRRRSLGWLWLLPLLLLLLLGGCFLLRGRGRAERGSAELMLTSPESAASIGVSSPLTFTGTGRSGETVTVSENGALVVTTKVDGVGKYSATVPAPAAGAHTYTVSETGTELTLNRAVTLAAAAGTAAALPTGTASPVRSTISAGGASSTPSTATSPPPASTVLAITAPASGSTVPAGALTLKGTGPADTELSVSEDRTSLGQARTDASGAWTFDVPGPAAGGHTYFARAGSASSDLKLTVAAGTPTVEKCTKAFSLSLKDGQTVDQPFRFGGVGSGKSYSVTVSRGTRRIGSKALPLDGGCGYSYTSKPGPGRVTYTLKETGQTTVASRITLNVKQ